MKEEWKCAIVISGVLFVMIPGVALMLKLYVGSWDILHQVSYWSLTHIDVSSVVPYNSLLFMLISIHESKQEPKLSGTPSLEVVMVDYFWTMLGVQEVNQCSLTALIWALEYIIVTTLKMLELGAQVISILQHTRALKLFILHPIQQFLPIVQMEKFGFCLE